MNIYVVTGVGTGHTKLSAFDSALEMMGIYNYNIIPLSSIIPPKSIVKKLKKYTTPDEEFGHKLYVIKADIRSSKKGDYIAAGLGWYQTTDGRGVFVEHEVTGKNKRTVTQNIRKKIHDSVKDLCKFRKFPYSQSRARMAIALTQVKAKPSCALVIAVYQSEGWK